ncbi:MAG: PilZ domain-containing protein [Terriglobales bacterium]|jgi:hypothetical protein
MSKHIPVEADRRRTPRFSCGGHAKVVCLPSDGIVLPGTIRDLSLGGCCVATPEPIACGARAEIIARVNAASFRAVGEVRAIRGDSTACLQFVHLTSGGRQLLADMVEELARLQVVMNKLKVARRDGDAELFRQELKQGKRQQALFRERFPFLRAILTAEALESDPSVLEDEKLTADEQPLVIPVDLFG